MAKAEASVAELVAMIQRGELRLPEMQRRYVWRATRVRDLLDSLYRGYPSGAILLWDTDEDVPLQEFSVDQQQSPYSTLRLLLDGQQRLTSLSAVIRGEPVTVQGRKRPIDLLFNLEHPDGPAVVTEVHEDSDEDLVDDELDSSEDELQRRINTMTFVVATRRMAQLPHWVRVSDVFRTSEDAPFLERAGIESLRDPRFTKYSQRLARLRAIRNYTYRMDVLERGMSYEEVTEIFVRVNSLGAKLRSSDLALAQVTSSWRGALATFQAFEQQCAHNGFPVELGVHLRNMIAIATGQSRFRTVGRLTPEALQAAWNEAVQGMQFAINFVRSNTQVDSPALLSSPFILVTVSYFAKMNGYELSPAQAAQLRRWVLLANVKGRYSRGSSETLLDQDIATLRDGGGPADLIDRLRLQVGRLEITADELRGRNQRSAIFKTMFLAFRDAGATDWQSNLKIALDHSGAQHKLQFHHVFPKALLARAGRTARDADDIANLAFIAGRTNRSISDKAPSVYMPAIAETAGAVALNAQCIPWDQGSLDVESYDVFLAQRRERIADRLNQFLGPDDGTPGASADSIDPYHRHLDERTERAELALRALISTALDGDASVLPEHVRQRVRDRVAAAVRKDPAQQANFERLGTQLQFCDLRELQDIITAKTLWPHFESVFGSKETLGTRFAQLAELRNALRHSRELTEVTRKDGEAALTWFAGVLQAGASGPAFPTT